MSLFYEIGFNIKRGREVAFQEWTAENDAALKASTPAGVEYLGTYVLVMSSEKDLGEYRVLWRLASFAAFDALEEATQDEKSDWGRLNREVTEFMDLPIGAQGTFAVLRPLIGAAIWEIS
jgi:hypothetical protein